MTNPRNKFTHVFEGSFAGPIGNRQNFVKTVARRILSSRIPSVLLSASLAPPLSEIRNPAHRAPSCPEQLTFS